MNDATIISDKGRKPVIALRRDDGVLIQAGKNIDAGEVPPVTAVSPVKARFA